MALSPRTKPSLSHLAALDAELALAKPKTALELAQPHAERAFQRLAELAESEQGNVALGAVRELLDRAYGKPVQAVAAQFDGKLTISWSMPGDEGITIDVPATQCNEK